MLTEIIRQINWVDILILVIFFRVCFIAVDNGFLLEVFKLLGILLATYLSLHYYTTVGSLIAGLIPLKDLPAGFFDFLSFIFLVACGCLLFVFVRSTFQRFLKTEATPHLNKWGGLILGLIRSFLVSGLIMFALLISNITYLSKSVHSSFLGPQMFRITVNVYSQAWEAVMSKFFAREEYNKNIPEFPPADSTKNK